MNRMNADEARTQGMLACLAVPSRFRLVRAIAEADRCVGELAISVGLSQSCTTRHLQALERAGLVKGRRDGRRVRFSLVADAEDSRDVLDLVLGDEGAAGPAAAAADRPEAPRSRRRERTTNTERRRNPLTRSDLGTAENDRTLRGKAGPDPGTPSDSGSQEMPLAPGPFRRHDIEDYLL
jgi:DNA-binding transcriptional ArsR family regulator